MPIFGIVQLSSWTWILCLFLFATSTSSNNECPEGEGCTQCHYSDERGYALYCAGNLDHVNFDPHFEVKYKSFVGDPKQFFLEITCKNSPDWSDFHLGEKKKILHVENVIFRKCHLPEDDKLSAIVKQMIFKPVSTLEFASRKNLTSTLTKQTLADFKNILILNLSHNKLSTVSADLLHDFNNLKELDLGSNDLYDIPLDFLNFPQLKRLTLNENKFQIIESRTLEKLQNLESLHMWGNELREIQPGSFDNLNKLFMINLRENKLTSLSLKIFDQLENLKNIDLSKNEFSDDSLPDNLFQNNKKLEIIQLSDNKRKLTTLPGKFFANLINLRTLKLDRNGFFNLPEDLLYGDTNLTHLMLTGNYLTTLPSTFFQDCQNLMSINMKNNIIESLPDKIFSSLKNLEELILSENRITEISNTVFGGLNIRKLDISYNNIDFINSNAFQNTNYLKIINLSNNGLKLDDSIGVSEYDNYSPFHYSVNTIEELYFDNNNITQIYYDWMMAVQLRILQLKNNQFDYLDATNLQFFSTETVEIDLQNNQISAINLADLEFMVMNNANKQKKPIVNVKIAHNPLICNCRIYQLLRYHEGRMIEAVKNGYKISVGDLVCAKPSELKDISLRDLNSKTFTCQLPNILIQFGIVCPDKCDCLYRIEDKATLMNCSYRGFTEVPRILYNRTEGHIELDLSGNFLKTMPLITDPGLKHVTVLSLSYNQISAISARELSENYTTLYLDNNNLTELDYRAMEFFANSTKLQQLTLHGNHWHCNCDTQDFLDFIQRKQSKYTDLQKVKCDSMNIAVFKMTPLDICPPPIGMISGIAVAIFLLLIMSISTALYYRHEHLIKVWLFHHQWFNWLVTEAVVDKDKIFDAFLSYSHKDEDFIVETLVPNLENGPRAFKLCIHYRDWLGGEWIGEQIRRSVADSRRTIVVVSKNFLESEWGRVEFRTAHCTALKEKRSRVIVIIYGDIGPIDKLEAELQMYMTTYTYIKWGDPWFWKKLKFSLPHHTDPIKMKKKDKKYSVYTSPPPTITPLNHKTLSPMNAV